ncbi:MAG: NirD/YgiW/YdeI family stress tolerance protein [Methyloprofundus sp.]|nr:NirD/YgiW/YdeI family stress tolerance protein [Methyloprofundus sp.]
MKTKLSIFLFGVFFSANLLAEFQGPGAVSKLTTVKAASAMSDDDKVTLEGFIVKQIKEEHYLFTDSTGEIEIEIESKYFRGLVVTPQAKIRIIGEVEKELFSSATIEVDSVQIIK